MGVYTACSGPPPCAASYESLDVVLRHDRRRIPLLLDFVRYPHNPAVQAEAARLATHLSGELKSQALSGLAAAAAGWEGAGWTQQALLPGAAAGLRRTVGGSCCQLSVLASRLALPQPAPPSLAAYLPPFLPMRPPRRRPHTQPGAPTAELAAHGCGTGGTAPAGRFRCLPARLAVQPWGQRVAGGRGQWWRR